MDNLLPTVQDIFRDVFDQPDLVITRESNAQTVEDWDSFAHLNLVIAIERQFKIKFALSELQESKNVGDLLDLVHKKLSLQSK
jgi:acyl carrier protein